MVVGVTTYLKVEILVVVPPILSQKIRKSLLAIPIPARVRQMTVSTLFPMTSDSGPDYMGLGYPLEIIAVILMVI